MSSIRQTIAQELQITPKQVEAVETLLAEGSTVPFIARYRKEVTGGLDDTVLRRLTERLDYLNELEARRASVISAIDEQGKLDPALKAKLMAASSKTELEELYLPYKKKRRTKGQIAIEAGLAPLASALFDSDDQAPEELAQDYLNADKQISCVKDALDGAKYILMERFAEDADLLKKLRAYMVDKAFLVSQVLPGKESEGAKFKDYFEHRELLAKVPSHRALAMFRARNEGIVQIELGQQEALARGEKHPCEHIIASHYELNNLAESPRASWLDEVFRWTWKVKISNYIETELLGDLRAKAEDEAIGVFARNLKDLLLAAPAGPKATIGLDPGLRTGVKVAVVDEQGKVLDHCAIFPTPPQKKIAESEKVLLSLCTRYPVQLIAIGNGTASRETEKFVKDFLNRYPQIKAKPVMVNEAGASIYSASEFAAKEFPDLDVTIRGAISIARRLQDPLAELVKIDPKSIGVGQYQHDVSQLKLARSLDDVVEDCVNGVGVDLNSASVPLLTRVAGLTQSTAASIVSFRDAHGAFKNREQLKQVPRLGDKTFEQAAGFLRIRNGEHPLDASGVHPETYPLVEAIATQSGENVEALIGNTQEVKKLKPEKFVTEQFGLPTIIDIISELEKPGRDPRPEFKTAQFKDGVEEMKDLEPGMVLEGTITNVTNFGAFVDVGVHQDGLVHISALADRYVKDPHTVVKAGDIVKAKVMEVDIARKRIALSLRLSDEPGKKADASSRSTRSSSVKPYQQSSKSSGQAAGGTMAELFKKAGLK